MLQLIKKKIYIVLNLELELGSFAVSSRSVLANCSGYSRAAQVARPAPVTAASASKS